MAAFRMLPEAEEEALLPRVLPVGWARVPWHTPAFDCHGIGGCAGLRALVSAGIEEDGRRWLHVSVSRRGRTPSWEDLDAVKRLFIGDERYAYQVHPPRAEHYNGQLTGALGDPGRVGNVLHLWAPLEGESPLPNFLRARGGTL